jgi:predicted enzyme related to lactoylglutathione lyase
MTIRVQTVSVDARDPRRMGEWWAEALGWEITEANDEEGEVEIAPPSGSPDHGAVAPLLFLRVPEGKSLKNRIHLDLRPDDQAAEVARFEGLGATRVDIGQGSEVTWVVLADPEGNEFCILRSRPQQQ